MKAAGLYRISPLEPTTFNMDRRLKLIDVLDKHCVMCPQCQSPKAVVVIDATFAVMWQCFDCETRWQATDKEAAMLLGTSLLNVH